MEEINRDKGWGGQNTHMLIFTLSVAYYPAFQPAAAKLNSAFLLTVNDIGDHRQPGWLAAQGSALKTLEKKRTIL